MKYIYINGRYLSQKTTGVQRFATELVSSLDNQMSDKLSHLKEKVYLVAPPNASNIPSLINIKVVKRGHLRGHLWEQIDLPLIARAGMLFNPCGPAPLFHSDQVTTIHDASVYVAPSGYSWKFRTWHKLLTWRSGKHAKLILTVSKFSKRQLSEICGIPRKKIKILYQSGNHILKHEPNQSLLKKYSLAEGAPYVLSVGSQQLNKNFSAVEKAAEILQEENVRFVVVGSTDSRIFRNASSSNQNIIFTGYVTDEELRSLYEHALCFVFPSRYEGFGIPPLEAMACGCPVIASEAASIPEACGSAALYFDPARPDILAEDIRRILINPELRQMLIADGFRNINTRTWEATVKQFVQYLSLACSVDTDI